ncbi:unnamed protein product [Rotaria sordida]|uniref:TRPM-like domain-containing protein n=1 Tax=Rotaria sordida TaxID=392033 RepID=A0A815DQV0_9BILA|nr:unnamed protein product [Rotaria sordida]CAF1301665.1 unnamed protein product [Rotaria sordida]
MSAALIAAGMAQHLSLSASTLDVRHTYTEQAKKYEVYATDCINACYQHDERLACQLLLRENPLFGNVTCMQLAVDYYTRMMERWQRSGIWMIPMFAMSYILFYIGIILYFQSDNRSDLLSDARIILAIDLEIWYLFSLRFVSAIKLLGPKLFMIRNMLRYLTAFMYVIFVCIAAYGVVSRALTMYGDIEFTAKSVFTAVFYRPYWFLHSIVDQEKTNLDKRLCKTPEMDAQGTEFENAATYNYARQLVEDNYRPKVEQETSKLDAQLNSMKNTIDKLQVQIDSLNRSNEQVRAETNAQTYRVRYCIH